MGTNIFNPADVRRYPSRWPLYRGKGLFRVIDERSASGDEELLSVSHLTGITPRSQKNVTMFQSESLIGYKICQIGDIVANTMWTWQGAIGVSDYAGVVSPAYNVYRQKDDSYHPKYLDMLLREPKLVDVYHSLSTGIRPSRLRLYPEVFLTIDFPVPPRDEQEKIVRFLDWKVSEINKLIGIHRKEIQKLEELKVHTIRRVFVKGFFSDAMIDSNGIDWLESSPQGWKIQRLKTVLHRHFGGTWGEDPIGDKNDLLCIRIADFDFNHLTVKLKANTYRHYSESQISKGSLQDGDIILEKSGGGDKTPVGRVICYHSSGDSKVMFANFSECLRPDKTQIVPFFLALELKAFYQSGHIRNYYNQTTGIQNITLPQYLSMPIVVPSKAEQERIVQYLDGACSKIDSLINSSHKKMAELTEMKQVMISDVVTGKIDVRNIIIPEYEHIDDIFDEYSEANNDEKEEKSTMEEE